MTFDEWMFGGFWVDCWLIFIISSISIQPHNIRNEIEQGLSDQSNQTTQHPHPWHALSDQILGPTCCFQSARFGNMLPQWIRGFADQIGGFPLFFPNIFGIFWDDDFQVLYMANFGLLPAPDGFVQAKNPNWRSTGWTASRRAWTQAGQSKRSSEQMCLAFSI